MNRSFRFRKWVEKWKDVGFLISAFLGAVSITLVLIGMHMTDNWERRKFTTLVMKEWNAGTQSHARTIFSQYPDLARAEFKRGYAIPAADADKLKVAHKAYSDSKCDRELEKSDADYQKCRHYKKLIDTRSALVSQLNYLEYLATSYKHDIIVKDTFEESFRPLFIWYLAATREFVNACSDCWPPFVQLTCAWAKDANVRRTLQEAVESAREFCAAEEKRKLAPAAPKKAASN